ncbi:MAG: hypothetical protein ABII12_00990 [Planctomycetota bacterium]
MNPVGDLQIPAEAISKQLEQMESAPAICVFLTPLIVLPLGMMILWLPLRSSRIGLSVLFCPGVLLLGGLMGLLVNILRFRKSCLAKPGWLGVFVRFCGYGISMLLAVLVLVFFGAGLLTEVCSDLRHSVFNWVHVGGLVVVVVAAFLFVRGVPSLHRRAKGEMETLQREVAVRIARDTMRRRLGWRMHQSGRG